MTAATLPVAVTRGDWLTAAACRDYPADWWELVGGGWKLSANNQAAIRVCLTECPVKDACRDAILIEDEGVIRAGFPLRTRNHRARDMARAEQRDAGTAPKPGPKPKASPTPNCAVPDPNGPTRHRRRGQESCDACRAAYNDHYRKAAAS